MTAADHMEAIPKEHREAVERAFVATLGHQVISAITPVGGGRSGALIYRVEAGGTSHLLRIVTRRDALANPERQFAAMQVAATGGVAPAVHFADAASGIAITEFIASVPWSDLFSTDAERAADLGRLVARLHAGPAMPEFLETHPLIDQGIAVLKGAGVVLSPLFLELLDQLVAVRAALQPYLTRGASHNDLNPGNLLFDGTRFWIVDWESAWQNDPMFDLGTILHWFGLVDERRAALLRGYFGREPTALEIAKLEAMRQAVSCCYAAIFLLLPLQRGQIPPPLDPDRASLPTFAEARQGMRFGTFPLASAEDHSRFSLIMVAEALRRAETPEFAAALALLREHGESAVADVS